MNFRNDYIYGINSEIEILEKLREHFNADLQIIDNKYSLFDFEAENILIELKSRKCYEIFRITKR